ncbi:TetR/AcrR family transcriptional regulator C-terminal domain-containing protein [Oceanobacillus jeddahense]|uniref:TetR/AcrR family transcriptional regulator C-terminal domain-containing protein n=1 Tax=Oceanobacillus jeddahense TaxID=1462527 RepID=A0ABY5JML3_9BACI|nr:TetR/AcrR family transcriptional regulator C-terminal domain-containing protein [Oceanobacillus jeddahense]UUI01054.1 TetR/AcrR family transcriptional regulator C-terminal domain-containing protein [Oceanobacillus jeddahense]
MSKNNSSHHKMLDKTQIMQAALDILQAEGYKNITIRKISQKLGIKSASLYWHFKNKNELLELIADEICKKVQFPEEELTWEEQLMQLGHEWRNTLLSITDSAVVLAETAPTTPYRIQFIQKIHDIFKKVGMSHQDAFSALWFFNTYLISFILEEYRFAEIKKNNQQVSTSEGSPPLHLTIPNMAEEFQFGMEVMIAGFKAKSGN